MSEPFWVRVRRAACRWRGHRETYSYNSRAYYCRRCNLLLRGALTTTPPPNLSTTEGES